VKSIRSLFLSCYSRRLALLLRIIVIVVVWIVVKSKTSKRERYNEREERDRLEDARLKRDFCFFPFVLVRYFNTARGSTFWEVFWLFDFFLNFLNFASYLSSLRRWISAIPIPRAFIGASLLSTHCSSRHTERAKNLILITTTHIFSRFSDNIII